MVFLAGRAVAAGSCRRLLLCTTCWLLIAAAAAPAIIPCYEKNYLSYCCYDTVLLSCIQWKHVLLFSPFTFFLSFPFYSNSAPFLMMRMTYCSVQYSVPIIILCTSSSTSIITYYYVSQHSES